MTAPTGAPQEFFEDDCPTPGCGKRIRWPKHAKQVVCPGCNQRFTVDDEAPPDAPPGPPPPAAPVSIPDAISRPADPFGPSTPPPAAPPGPPPAAVPPTPPPAPVTPPPPAAPVEAEITGHEDDPAVPVGAGDAANAREARRRVGRKRIALAPRPEGVTDFIYRSREFQWVAKGGIGCPYGPKSYSVVLWDALLQAGERGLDLVDLAVETRRRLRERNEDCQSIIQRVVMVCERIGIHPAVGFLERVTPDGVPNPNGLHYRIVAKHRVAVPIPPADMVGVERRRELEEARRVTAPAGA